MSKKVRVGAVQAEPVWLDLEGSVEKTISLIKQSAAEGIQVLGFPEVWIPGYPWYELSCPFHRTHVGPDLIHLV
jgi:nitrilase